MSDIGGALPRVQNNFGKYTLLGKYTLTELLITRL